MIKILKANDYAKMSDLAAKEVLKELKVKPNLVLGLATGSTPEGMYQILSKDFVIYKTDWSQVITFNLDEYIGIPSTHPLSYHSYMEDKLFAHININHNNIHIPDGCNDPQLEGKRYDDLISHYGGIDLQILGIGENAHIAFNEPGSSDNQSTRLVVLTQSTIKANSRFFDSIDKVPKTAITMGIKSILKAKKIILLASGLKKAEAIFKTINSPISPDVPSSYLQKHADVTIILDKAAASLLENLDKFN